MVSAAWMIFVAETVIALNSFVDRMFATRLPSGSVAAIAYSTNLLNFAIQVFTLSLTIVMFTGRQG